MKADAIISLDHGSGGLASQNLISGLFLKYLTSPQLRDLEDCAVLGEYAGRIAFSTDSYVVDPLFFPGGDIGALAVHGTINDLAMRGARPIALSLALIIEEGFPVTDLERIIASVGRCSEQAGVAVVTGDTKVVPRGKADGLFINTTGTGIASHRHDSSDKKGLPGDAVILSRHPGRPRHHHHEPPARHRYRRRHRQRHPAHAPAGRRRAGRGSGPGACAARPDPGRPGHLHVRDCLGLRSQHHHRGRPAADPARGQHRL
jgi:Hydrogenase maturation factor